MTDCKGEREKCKSADLFRGGRGTRREETIGKEQGRRATKFREMPEAPTGLDAKRTEEGRKKEFRSLSAKSAPVK